MFSAGDGVGCLARGLDAVSHIGVGIADVFCFLDFLFCSPSNGAEWRHLKRRIGGYSLITQRSVEYVDGTTFLDHRGNKKYLRGASLVDGLRREERSRGAVGHNKETFPADPRRGESVTVPSTLCCALRISRSFDFKVNK